LIESQIALTAKATEDNTGAKIMRLSPAQREENPRQFLKET
jgi:hypothetical protein